MVAAKTNFLHEKTKYFNLPLHGGEVGITHVLSENPNVRYFCKQPVKSQFFTDSNRIKLSYAANRFDIGCFVFFLDSIKFQL